MKKTIAELERKIELQQIEIAKEREQENNIQASLMEKYMEVDQLEETIKLEAEQRLILQQEQQLQQQQQQQQATQTINETPKVVVAVNTPEKPVETTKSAEFGSFLSKFKQEEQAKPEVPIKRQANKSDAEGDKEQDRLMRTIVKDPSKQPVKVVVPKEVVKPTIPEKKVEPKALGPSFLESLQQKEGTPRLFKWETWDPLDTVHLVGTMTNWQLLELPRVKGVFMATLPLSSGTHYFRYKVNNKFELEKSEAKGMAEDGEYATKLVIP